MNKTKRPLHGKNHLNARWRGWTQPTYAHGWTYSLSLQLHPFFPFKHEFTMKGFTSPCCWSVMSTGVVRLELQSLKFTEMLSPLMLRLELQNMKISHYIFVFKFILLSIFYLLLLLYHSTNVIIPLECHQLIIVVWLKPQII